MTGTSHSMRARQHRWVQMPVSSDVVQSRRSEKPCASGQRRDWLAGKLCLWKCAAAGESGWLSAHTLNTSRPAVP